MSVGLFSISVCVSVLGLTNGFICYQCSYDILKTADWNLKECMEDPMLLDHKLYMYPCNDTAYCVFQEMFDIHLRIVTSYDRRCSKTSQGNTCVEDATRLTCFGSCQGNLCNKNDTGHQYMKYYGYGNDSPSLYRNPFHYILFIFGLAIVHSFTL